MMQHDNIEKHINRLRIIGEYNICDAVKELLKEHEAALNDLHGLCFACKHNNTKVCNNCIQTPRIFEEVGSADNWEWRGKRNG